MSFSALFKKLLESIFCHDPFHYNEDYEFLDYIIWAELAARCDFCFSVLKFKYHRRRWQALKSLTTQCGWIFPYEKVCIICDRPRLIQGIGYDRICQELAAIELDSWQEYTLLSIDFADDFDDEGNTKPVYLLKMTCPSTGLIHALRVPPDINSAREASRWTNWGIDPENFSVQT